MAVLEEIVTELIDKTNKGKLQWEPSTLAHPEWRCRIVAHRTFRVTNIFSDPQGFALYLEWFNNKVFMPEHLGRGEPIQPLVEILTEMFPLRDKLTRDAALQIATEALAKVE